MYFQRPARPTPGPIATGQGELVPKVTMLIDCLRRARAGEDSGAHEGRRAAETALTAAIGAERRLADLGRRVAQLETLAMTDELTGLLNRRGLEAELHHATAAARRYGECGLVVYVDLDGFKRVNDTYGHAAGDAVLREVARLLAGAVRATDFVGRLGGDEFAVVLTRTDGAGGATRVRRIDRLLNPVVVDWQETALYVGASIGVEPYGADGPGDGAEPEDAPLARADQAMYAAKRLRSAAANAGA